MVWFVAKDKNKDKKKEAKSTATSAGAGTNSTESRTNVDIISEPAKGLVAVRSMLEGTGGLVFFGNEPAPRTAKESQRFRHIGTTACLSYVGVYFELGVDRCFCAHIHARVNESQEPRSPSPEVAKMIRQDVREKLERHESLHNWSKKDVVRNTLVIVCPLMDSGPGEAVKDGILEFLNLREGDVGVTISDKHHGFIIEPGNPQSRTLLFANTNVKRPQARDFQFEKAAKHGFCIDADPGLPKEWRYTCKDK